MSITEQDLLANLNPPQAEAVTHHGSPLLIVAGAGSGKTRVITHRIAWLSHAVGIPLWQILAVTFTNKAAREMRERVCRILGRPDDPSLAIGTFHSRCAMILRRDGGAVGLDRSFAILDDRDQLTAVKRAMEEVGISEKQVRPRQVQEFINLAKMKLLAPDDCDEEFDQDEVPYPALYRAYQGILDRNDSVDFEDLIFKAVQLLRDHPSMAEKWRAKFRYVLIDEFQDTNHSQLELVKHLVGPGEQISVVGDEDQAIYSWRGADVSNLLQFNETYPSAKIVRLEQNYRSKGTILRAASGLIAHNTMRLGKTLWTEQEDGDRIRALAGRDEAEEAELVAQSIALQIREGGVHPGEIAVFYRSHRLARPVEDAFNRMRIPYRVVGGVRFYDRAEIKDLLCFLRLAVSPSNDLAFERVVNTPVRGIGKKSQEDIARFARDIKASQFDAARRMLADGAIKGRAKGGLQAFVDMIASWNAISAEAHAGELLARILADTDYKQSGIGDPESLDGQARVDNIEEFVNVVAEFEQAESANTVQDFLEAMALDAQREEGGGSPKVSLMTVHNAKGLEFDVVHIIGLEHGLFPNSRILDDPAQYEEERRLFYVAMTRARERLVFSRAMRRMRTGFYDDTMPSAFLAEVPEDAMAEGALRKLGVLGAAAAWGGMGGRAGDVANSYGGVRASLPPPRNPRGGLAGAERVPKRPGQRFAVGDRVEHRVLGEGTVTETGGRPGSERVYVEFDDGRGQEFVVKFAPLKPLGGDAP